MQFIRGIRNISPSNKGCVVTIGNFDGVHRGHQMVLQHLIDRAKAEQAPTMVIVFEPHPQEFFLGSKAPARLYNTRDKFTAIEALGIDHLLCLRFDKKLASMPAEDFVHKILYESLGVRHLVLGDDFRFGAKRTGDFKLLESLSSRYGYTLEHLPSFKRDDQRVSSTVIRQALKEGRLDTARQLLGNHFHIAGRVRHGDKRGRTINFPTANIALKRCVPPIDGVFAVHAKWKNTVLSGVANVGKRPTVGGETHQLEVHFFDFDQEIYGDHLQVEFLEKIRSEQRFASFEALREQIKKDCETAKRILKSWANAPA